MKVLFEHEKANLRFNEETKAIELIWKKIHDVDTYKMVFSKALVLFQEYNAINLLSDIRNEGVVSPTTSRWVQEEILAKAYQSGLKKIAIVMESDVFKEFYIENIRKKTTDEMLQSFDSYENANAWLKS
jgi:hypothetical protein